MNCRSQSLVNLKEAEILKSSVLLDRLQATESYDNFKVHKEREQLCFVILSILSTNVPVLVFDKLNLR